MQMGRWKGYTIRAPFLAFFLSLSLSLSLSIYIYIYIYILVLLTPCATDFEVN
jgi:hypothetical protein